VTEDAGSARGSRPGDSITVSRDPSSSFWKRGGAWVVAQSIVFVLVGLTAFAGGPWPAGPRLPFRLLGDAFALAGLGLGGWSFAVLGRSLTPLPRPRADGRLVERGAYRRVRHPIYSAVLLLAVGASLVRSPLALVPTIALALLFDRKARREETWLEERFSGYPTYRRRTRWRFVPGIY
jgi:protein-S-isoprenylcysteine O-methyltransferase Ste14